MSPSLSQALWRKVNLQCPQFLLQSLHTVLFGECAAQGDLFAFFQDFQESISASNKYTCALRSNDLASKNTSLQLPTIFLSLQCLSEAWDSE